MRCCLTLKRGIDGGGGGGGSGGDVDVKVVMEPKIEEIKIAGRKLWFLRLKLSCLNTPTTNKQQI